MAGRGRPRKPVPELILEGKYRSDRHGEAATVWLPEGSPEKPEWLTDDAVALWDSIVPPLVGKSVVTAVDAPELAAMCDWWGRYRQATRDLDEIDDHESTPYYRLALLASMSWKNFAAAASRFGLNPSDRAKLRLDPGGKQQDELLNFAREQRDINGRGHAEVDTERV